MARYYWITKSLIKLDCEFQSCLELGCFDGKAIDFFPVKPVRYVGLDANWEGGLDLAQEKWQGEAQYEFRECAMPADMQLNGEEFDISICMETLEHLPPDLVGGYLKELAKATKNYIFISVPNEIGIVFLSKHLIKKIVTGAEPYTFAEIINSTLGRTDKVARNEHKGFHYKKMIAEISEHFSIVDISGLPLAALPPYLNFGIGIIAKRKPE